MKIIKNLLVTGATGFLGSVLVEKLLSEGYTVIGIGQKKYGLLLNSVVNSKKFIFIQRDLTNISVNDLRDFQIDGILHLANRGFVDSQGNFNKEIGHDEIYDVNIKATKKLIELTKIQKAKFFIFASTISVFGKRPDDLVISESTHPTPMDYYGLTKFYAEKLIEIELSKTDVKGIVLRFPLIVGKNHLGGLLYNFYKLAVKNEPIVIYGKGNAYRCPLYIEDAISIMLRSIKYINDLDSFELFACGSSNSMTISDIAKEVIKFCKSESRLKFTDKPFSLDWDMKIDISKIKKKLKFNPLTVNEVLKLYLKELGC